MSDAWKRVKDAFLRCLGKETNRRPTQETNQTLTNTPVQETNKMHSQETTTPSLNYSRYAREQENTIQRSPAFHVNLVMECEIEWQYNVK